MSCCVPGKCPETGTQKRHFLPIPMGCHHQLGGFRSNWRDDVMETGS